MAAPILKKTGFNKEEVKHVQDCIVSHRYRTGHTPQTIEAKILFDADKLDTAGAIGIARCFMWVARNNARIYREVDAQKYAKENLGGKLNGRIQDKTKHSPQIEFKTKLIFLKDKLNTPQAKKICKKRLEFFEKFLKRLEKEIKGKV